MTSFAIRAVAIVIIAAGFAAGIGHREAAAQTARVYVDEGYAPAARGARVYGYSRRADEPGYRVDAPIAPRNCGEFHYWNGEFCADARVTPPYVGPEQ